MFHTLGSGYQFNNATSSSRVDRLLRERELRKHSKSLGNGSRDGRDSDPSSAVDIPCNDGEAFDDSAGNPSDERKLVLPEKQRLLVVANRLPVHATRKKDDTWQLEISAGGLVSALLGLKDFEARWIGWAGLNLDDEGERETLTKALAVKRCIPVFLDENTVHQYYNGYSNNILWPLFHYLGLPHEDRLSTTHSFQSQLDAYKQANQIFADVVIKHYKEGDIVWCHDYHLMYLPKWLKGYNNRMKVGWFLHTPFPSSEILRTLPSRSELLRSVLAADIIGFHTYDYARHFVSSCTRILGLESTSEGVEYQGKLTRVTAFPIGIDYYRFVGARDLIEVQDYVMELKQRFAGKKVMLGVDRLDMIKGIPQKLLAFEKFLEENEDWRDKVVLVQIAVPTRTDVPEYQKLTSQVHEIVGRINGKYGTLSTVPLHHLDRSIDFHALCALYAETDVLLVTSLRDGMNLVSYEFVACQASKKGVLILSEFAGAAQSLGAGAVLVNPWNVTEVADAIAYALNMPADEREKRHQHNFMHVTTHTSQEWAEMFVSELNDTVLEAQLRTTQIPPSLPTKLATEKYKESRNRLLILGFNTTLTQSVETPGERGDQIKDMELKLHPELKEPLRKLCDEPNTTVLILSGSDRNILDINFSEFNIWLAAENGMFLRHTSGEWKTTLPEFLCMEWVQSIKHVFEYFTERTPRSHFEVHETSLLWSYKYSDIEFGRLQARDMLQHLWGGPISNAPVEVFQGARSIEVRAAGVTKGAAIDRIMGEIYRKEGMESPINYVLCLGHFLGKAELQKVDILQGFLSASLEPGVSSATTSLSLGTGDEDIYAFFEPDLCPDQARTRPMADAMDEQGEMSDEMVSSILDLNGENYFSCAVGRKRSCARYLLGSADEVFGLLEELAGAVEE